MSVSPESESSHETDTPNRFEQFVLDHTYPVGQEESEYNEVRAGNFSITLLDNKPGKNVVPFDGVELLVWDVNQDRIEDSFSIRVMLFDWPVYSIKSSRVSPTSQPELEVSLGEFGDFEVGRNIEAFAGKLINDLIALEKSLEMVPKF